MLLGGTSRDIFLHDSELSCHKWRSPSRVWTHGEASQLEHNHWVYGLFISILFHKKLHYQFVPKCWNKLPPLRSVPVAFTSAENPTGIGFPRLVLFRNEKTKALLIRPIFGRDPRDNSGAAPTPKAASLVGCCCGFF